MKSIKKIFALLLAVVMVMGLSVTAFAQDVDCKGSDNGTITVENATIGQTYTIYKIFDATYGVNDADKVSYTFTKTENNTDLYNALVADGSPFTLTSSVNDSSVYVVTLKTTTKTEYEPADYDPDSDETYYTYDEENDAYVEATDPATETKQLYVKVVETVNAYTDEQIIAFVKTLSSYLTELAKAEATENTVVFTNLDYGYYYITSSLGTVVTIDSAVPTATVIDKNTQNPGNPDKKIVGGDSEDATTADVGDTVNYSVTFTAVNYVTANEKTTLVQNYVVKDTPTNLDLQTDGLKVTVLEKDATTATELDLDTDYTVSKDETSGVVTVTIDWATDEDQDGTDDTSIYKAPATVTITYSAIVTGAAATTDTANNSVALYYNNDTQVGTDTTNVKLFEFSINKVNASNEALTGAKFELYSDAAGTTKINLVAVKDTTDTSKVAYYRPATTAEASDADFESAVIEAGTATIKGLDDGTYYLKETAAPDGYNLLTSLVKVTIDANGAVTVGDSTTALASTTVDVINETGTELPSTGGIGTTIFYVVGSILVIGAAVLLITKKRMSNVQ